MGKGKKKVRKAEGIILLICLDPVKLQIALNQCFMAVLQISFIYTLYGRTRRNHLSVSYPPPSRVLFLSLGDKELTPVTKIYNSCKKRHVLAFGNNFIPSALSPDPMEIRTDGDHCWYRCFNLSPDTGVKNGNKPE